MRAVEGVSPYDPLIKLLDKPGVIEVLDERLEDSGYHGITLYEEEFAS